MLAAGIVQLDWTGMAPSQQVQPRAAHASVVLESEQSNLTVNRTAQAETNQEAMLAQL